MNRRRESLKEMENGYLLLEALVGILFVGMIAYGGFAMLKTVFPKNSEINNTSVLKSIEESHFRSLVERDCAKGEYKLVFNGRLQSNGTPFRQVQIQEASNGELPEIQKAQDRPGEVSSSLLITSFTGEVISYYESLTQESSEGIQYTVTRYGPELGRILNPTNLLEFKSRRVHSISDLGQDIPRFEFHKDSENLHLFLPDFENRGETLTFGTKFKSKKVI